jgi:hypothetical protein
MYEYYKDGREFYRKDTERGSIKMVEASEDESHVTKGVTAPKSIPDSAVEVNSIPGCVRKELGNDDRLHS